MTDEQIKQNAEQYADDEKQYYLEIGCYDLICEAYIAGAHSRDDEIEQLRNPWISVEERLPEKIKNKGVSKYVFATWPDGTLGKVYYNYEEYKAPRWEIKGAGITKPAYWMPIPDIY